MLSSTTGSQEEHSCCRMVKKSICLNPIMVAGRTGYPGKAFQNGSITTLHGQQLTCNVFLAAVRRVGTSPMDSARSSIFALVRPAKGWHVQWEAVPPGEKSETP